MVLIWHMAYSEPDFHSFRLLPVKFFAKDMRNVVKPTGSDEKMSFAEFAFEVQIFQLLRNFFAAKPIRLLLQVTSTCHSNLKFFKTWPSHSLIRQFTSPGCFYFDYHFGCVFCLYFVLFQLKTVWNDGYLFMQ